MPKKKACDKCGKVHIDKVHKTCKGYICSDCVRAKWGKKDLTPPEVVVVTGGFSMATLLEKMKRGPL